MFAIRSLLAHRRLVLLLCAATLLAKLLVPSGYMIASDHERTVIAICSGTGPATLTVAMPGMDHAAPGHGDRGDHGKAEMPCAFAGLSAAVLAPLDPIQLAALIAFVMAAGLIGAALPLPAAPVRLRPPPRGPPAFH